MHFRFAQNEILFCFRAANKNNEREFSRRKKYLLLGGSDITGVSVYFRTQLGELSKIWDTGQRNCISIDFKNFVISVKNRFFYTFL